MLTIERMLPSIEFKEIDRKKVFYLEDFDNSTAMDRVASSVLLNEDNAVMGKIIGKEKSCPYMSIQGCGCYIAIFEYAENVPDFDVVALLKDFTSACCYAIKCDLEKDRFVYKYNYMWFTAENDNIATSTLLGYYGPNAEKIHSDNKIHVYAVPVRDEVIKVL